MSTVVIPDGTIVVPRTWRVGTAYDNRGTGILGGTNAMDAQAVLAVWEREYESLTNAEKAAELGARNKPGRAFAVYEIVSSFCLNGLVRATPGDLQSVAKDADRAATEDAAVAKSIAERMRTNHPLNKHAVEWADWIDRTFGGQP